MLNETIAPSKDRNNRTISSVTIVVPCYNEAERLPTIEFKTFACSEHSVRFLFVNDGSTDSTLKVLDALHVIAPDRFQVCNLPENVGKAEATRTGMLLALDSASDYVGYWDADLATPLRTICAFRDRMDSKSKIEMVFGARVRLLGRVVERSALRHYPGRIFATVASQLLRISVYDTQCGAKLFRTSDMLRTVFEEPFITKWLFDVEIIARLIQARRGTSLPQPEEIVYEYPLEEWHDVAGSKVKPHDFLIAFIGLARIYWRYLRPSRICGNNSKSLTLGEFEFRKQLPKVEKQ